MNVEERFRSWAEVEDDIRAAALVGSRARMNVPADEWSDYDIAAFARDPDALLGRDDWVRELGDVRLTFLEPTATGDGRERRVLYDDGTDVDFAVLPAEAIVGERAAEVVARGIKVLLDKDGMLAERLADVPPAQPRAEPSSEELSELVNDFFYHAVWAAKKLRRGELFTAKQCVDSYMKALLLRMLEWHARARDPEVDTWHRGRFLEQWAEPRAVEELRAAYAHYDEEDVRRVLFATIELFRRLSKQTAERIGLAYPDDADEFATGLTERILDPAEPSTMPGTVEG